MNALNLAILLIASLVFSSAHASSGQALRELTKAVQESQGLLYGGTIEAQICDDQESSQYLLFVDKEAQILAVSVNSGFTASNGDEGWMAADTAELINIQQCTHSKVRIY
ncbi:hypothetical protein [Bdellovibrio sp. HCB288]|uniref:hypothetical protein n=1 Tax=Bdellovibrio sp. HCB288 TaxID=3394355 RepID=UPI0039B58077